MSVLEATLEEFPAGRRPLRSALETRSIYRSGRFGCVSFNGMQDIARIPVGNDVLSASPVERRRPFESTNVAPYAALVLRNPKHMDRFLNRLVLPDNEIPYYKKRNEKGIEEFWFLKDLVESWLRLESQLRTVGRYAVDSRPSAQSLPSPPPPSSYGFDKPYESYGALREHVLDGKYAFDLYVAWAVYVVSLCASPGGVVRDAYMRCDSDGKTKR